MITLISPRIHNLGDFSHCLPMISGFVKKYGKVSFGICPRMKRFNGLIDMLMYQGLFTDVWFCDEQRPIEYYIVIDDSGSNVDNGDEAIVCRKFYNFMKQHYNNDFELDCNFELRVPDITYTDHTNNKYIVGDRWSPNEAPDVDDRRLSNITQYYDFFKNEKFFYLDYKNDLLTNLSIIKHNKNPFITTFTGIGILSDMMNKETIVLWDDDIKNWDNKPILDSYLLHYYKNRKSKLQYIKHFNLWT